MTRLNKQKLERLRGGLIDVNYTIKRLDRENASKSEKTNWLNYKNDILNLINKLQGAKNEQ
jgi:hypothetical protein